MALRLFALIHPLCHASITLAIMALLSASHPTFAHETDRKVYPGTFCQNQSPFEPEEPVTEYDELGAIRIVAFGDSIVTVVCPVVRDETMGTSGISRAFVRYVKSSGSGDEGAFSCTLYSRNHFGVEVGKETKRDTGPAGTKIFSFGAMPSSADQRVPGYYHFVCKIPRLRGDEDSDLIPGIISYRVDEIRTSQAEELSLDEDDEGEQGTTGGNVR